MNDKQTDDAEKQQNSKLAHPKQGAAFSRFGFSVGRVVGAGSSSESTKSKTAFRTSPIPNLLGGCRMRGYSSSAVDDALSFSPRARIYTDETSSLRHEKESSSSEPPLSRSNSLINPVALTLLHQVIDDDDENDTTMKNSRSPSPEIMHTTSEMSTAAPFDDFNEDDETMQPVEDQAPPSVHSDPPQCCRPRAIRPN